jgi:hypothetical protein
MRWPRTTKRRVTAAYQLRHITFFTYNTRVHSIPSSYQLAPQKWRIEKIKINAFVHGAEAMNDGRG